MEHKVAGYTFYRISKDRYSDLQYLIKAAFGEELSISRFEKKYDTSDFSVSHVGYIAYCDRNKKPAAYYGVFPIMALLNGEEVLVAQSGDTMTHPDHSRKGLFLALARNTYQLCTEVGIELVFGFPNKNSFPGFKRKLNWTFVGSLLSFVCVREISLTRKFQSKFGLLGKSIQSRFSRLPQLDEFTSESWHVGFQLPKSKNYICYKSLFGGKLFEYKGVEILGKISSETLVIGAFFKTGKTTSSIEEVIKSLSKYLLVRQIQMHVSPAHESIGILETFMTCRESLPIGYIPMNGKFNHVDFVFESADFDTF